MQRTFVTISVDTEEDNWGSFARTGATTLNVGHLHEVQQLFERYGARPTYLVNSPPLASADSVAILGELSTREGVEIGAHCHPWNTPPFRDEERGESMMWALPLDSNREKVAEVARRIEIEIGVRPTTFRSGRWSFDESVATAISEAGFVVDASVTPFLDWSPDGGPDYSTAPYRPYRFEPPRPLRPDPKGSMAEIPATIGFLRGEPIFSSRVRLTLERSPLSRFKVVGVLDKAGFFARRWLSPEHTRRSELLRLADVCAEAGNRVLSMTFHSPTLLPGATPFVKDAEERRAFLDDVEAFLDHCRRRGWTFATLGEVGEVILRDRLLTSA